MSAYNLFRSSGAETFYCAVPEHRALPSFVRAPVWQFSGKMDEAVSRPFAFDGRAAETGARLNGFHLFPCFNAERPSAP